MKGKRSTALEDTVFFSVFAQISEGDNAEETLCNLRADCLAAALPLCDGYIWQHHTFDLSLHLNSPGSAPRSCPCALPPPLADDAAEDLPAPAPPPLAPHLHGKVRYGDNIDDEWFVVFLLFSVSRRVPDACVRVWDSDGEFLLIEAAYSIPRWLKPENSWNRVFVKDGAIHILPLPSSPAELFRLPPHPSIRDALRVLHDGTIKTRAEDSVQEAILRKLSGFQQNPTQNMHNIVCRLPLTIAQVLKHEPQLVALAVDSFYNRDMDSMKAASQMRYFLPSAADAQFVEVMVRMSRAMYAQLKQQVFQAPRCYPMPNRSDAHYAEAELGMKLTCGFEMLYWECADHGTPVRLPTANMKGSKDASWQAFLASLRQSGYFKDLLEGSKEYRELKERAMSSYQTTSLASRVSAAMRGPIQRIVEILALPHSVKDFASHAEMKSDDDSWLYDGENELQNAMSERQKELDMYEHEKAVRKAKRSQKLSNEKMTKSSSAGEEVVKGIHNFINKLSSYEGAEFPEDEVHDERVTLKMENFLKELRSAFSPELDTHQNSSSDEMDTSLIDSDSDVETIERGWPPADNLQGDLLEDAIFMEEYGEALSRELTSSSVAKSFATKEKTRSSTDSNKGTNENMEGLPPVNIDVNLLENILESFSSQHGLPGPASNLLGAMGLNIPEDKDKGKLTLR